MIPQRAPDQTFADHQAEMAKWAGYPDARSLNRDHDPLHLAVCDWLGVTSHSMRAADGEPLTRDERLLAAFEEEAVLMLQRFMRHAGARVPAKENVR